VLDKTGNGSNRVLTSISYALAAGMDIEGLATSNAAGTAPINLTGNALGNQITGNAGANVITGGLGVDSMNGGGGADRYDFNAVAESPYPGSPDTVTWESGDLIDLSTIDANPLVAGDQAFTFIGTAAFTAPGQVHTRTISGLTGILVEINVGGVDTPEMILRVMNGAGFGSSAFLL
jgi:hypothetical protein